jgi:hypothetical protein
MSARSAPSLGAQARPPIHANGKRRESFKQIDCVDLRRLAGLPPAALKVWLYHHGRSGENDTSYPSLETIASETGQNLQTVKRARKWLRLNGWLIDEGGHRTGGRASVRIIRCLIPPENPRPRVVFPPSVDRPRVDSSTSNNPPTEVDSKLFEVYGTGSNLRFSPICPEPMTALSPQTIKGMKQTARTISVAEGGLEPDLVDIALLRIADLARALKKSPHSVAYFVASVTNSLADPDETEQCRFIAAERRRSGVPIDAPLRPDEWHVKSKIALLHESVEVAERAGRPASEVQAEMAAAIQGGA